MIYLLSLVPRAYFHLFEKSLLSAILMAILALVSFVAICYLMARVARRSLVASEFPITMPERRLMYLLCLPTFVVLASPIHVNEFSVHDVIWIIVMIMIFAFTRKIRKA